MSGENQLSNELSNSQETDSTFDPIITLIKRFISELLSDRTFRVGFFLFIPVLLLLFLAPPFAPDPNSTAPVDAYAPPSTEYLFGTDHLGRDLFSRVMLGGRTSFLIGFGSVAFATAVGVPIGLAAGYKKGRVDELLMRGMDIVMSIPTLLLALLIVTGLGPSLENAILAIGIVYAPRISRVVRASTLTISNEEYVLAAKARGESDLYILFREILPNILGPLSVEASIRVGFAMIVGASLSFLGLGAQPPTPDWGYMIAASLQHVYATPWFMIWPSLAFAISVLSINLMGDGLSDAVEA